MSLTIWCNATFSEPDTKLLVDGTREHKLIFAPDASAVVLNAGRPDPQLLQADVAFGQPDVGQCMTSDRLRWVEVTTAGYTRYDTPEFREAFERGDKATR